MLRSDFYQPPGLADKFPRIQLLSIEELLAGKSLEYPRLLDATFKKAPKAKQETQTNLALPLDAAVEEE